LRAVIIANGPLTRPPKLRPGDLLIAADGGARHCLELGLTPKVVIGDMDSLTADELKILESAGGKVIRHPARKDFTDLELALSYAVEAGADPILVYAALGARWDQTLANLLLPAAREFASTRIRLVDGDQEIQLLRGGESLELTGSPGDTVSLIPVSGDASGITTEGLEYGLLDGSLVFGSTRGISNVLLAGRASVSLRAGLLICVVFHTDEPAA